MTSGITAVDAIVVRDIFVSLTTGTGRIYLVTNDGSVRLTLNHFILSVSLHLCKPVSGHHTANHATAIPAVLDLVSGSHRCYLPFSIWYYTSIGASRSQVYLDNDMVTDAHHTQR